MPLPTPFHSRTKLLNQRQEWSEWAGHFASVSYQVSHEIEYFAIRNAAGLIDVSPLYKYEIEGPDAGLLVNRIMTRDVQKCRIGQVMYGPWCDENGFVIDDGTISRLGKSKFRITAADPNLRWFQDVGFGMDAEVRDVSDDLAALSIQGPNSRAILLELTGETELNSLRYFHFLKTNFRGKALTISRTGFTGDLGYELWVEPKNAEFLWDRLMEIGQSYGLLPVGLAALDMTRVEAGLLLFNVDYTSARSAVIPSQNSTPFELGLGWAVKMEQDNFIGRSALKEKNKAESAREFVGLEIDWVDLEILFGEADLPPQVAGRASRTSLPVYKNDIQIGQATSVLFSPLLKKYIALATLNKSLTKKDLHVEVEITVEYERKRAKAKIVKLPFYNPRRKKSIANG